MAEDAGAFLEPLCRLLGVSYAGEVNGRKFKVGCNLCTGYAYKVVYDLRLTELSESNRKLLCYGVVDSSTSVFSHFFVLFLF